MKYQSLYDFYFFGTCLRYLQDIKENYPIKEQGTILDNIDSFFTRAEELQLKVTAQLAHNKLDDIVNIFEGLNDDATISEQDAVHLTNQIHLIRDTLEAEIIGIGAYTPTPKRLDLKHLLEDVSPLFAPETFNKLPEISRLDFMEAGKCIAFERPTAAAFHILRGTEGVLRYYYESMIRSSRIGNRMWGPIVNDLRSKNKTKKYDILNNHLDNIRSSFRNPTQHPEATYDIHEVQDLWSVCVDVINRMIKTATEEGRI